MSEKKIETFLDTVYGAAEAKSKKMIREIDRAGEASIREYRAELRRSADADRRRERARAARLSAETAAHDESEIRRALLDRRNEIADEVFAEVKANLEVYRNTEDYAKSIVRDAVRMGELLSGSNGAYLILSDRDSDFAPELERVSGLSVVLSPKIGIGGVIGVSAEAEYDCTLDSALEGAKADFREESGLSVV